MADKKINVVFDASVKANVGNLKGIVNKLQKELNNLEMPNGVTKNFEKEIKTLVNELQIFESLTAGGIGNLGDAKKVNASWEKISSTLRTIGIQIDDLKLNPANIFSKEVGVNINKATKGLNEYLAKVEKIKKENEEYQGIQAKKRKAEDALPDLRKEASKDRKNADAAKRKYENRQEVWDKQYKDDYEKLEQEISDKEKQLQAKEKEIATLRSKRQEFRNQGIIGQEKNSLKDSEIASLRLAEKIAEYDEAEAKATEAQKQYLALKRSASSKKGYYTKQKKLYGENSEEAKKAKNASEQAETAANNAKAAMEAAQKVFQSKSPITQEARDSLPDNIKQLQEAEKVLLDLKDAQNKFNQLKNEKEEKEGTRSEEAKTFKKNLNRAESDARIAEQLAQQTENSLKEAENEIAQLEGKLSQIEAEGTAEEWQKLINIVKELTGQDLTEAGRDIEAFKKALEDYKTKELEKTPQTLEKISTTAKSTASSMSEVDRAVDGATSSFKDLTREQQDMERFKDNILDFFSIGNTIQIFKNALRDAFDTVKELDAAMTETAVVTDFSIGDMWEKLPEYSKTASELGSSIKDLYGATTLYYQQGLNTEQAMSVGIETMKMARIANMEGADATKAMTAALRGFNMEISETSAKRVNDVYSELAAITAADTQQIATAMTKTASIADSANMDFEVTAALLAQIIETTQEAPETAGTALKTIIARFTEVKELFDEGMLTGKDSEGEVININKIDAALQTVGISLKDFLSGRKGIDDIFLELASKWDTLDLATQRYIATTAAGSRQQSRFIAMMSNYDRTMELVGAANDSAGASNEQFEKTLDSLDAKLERLNNAWQEFTMNLANNELIKFGVDFLANFLETINSITEALSGGNGMVKSILTLGEVVVGLKTGKNIFNSVFRGISSSLPEGTQMPWWMHLLSGGEGRGQKGKFKVFQSGLSQLGNVAKIIGDINRGLEKPRGIKLPKEITDIAAGATDWFNKNYRWQSSKVLSNENRQKIAEAFKNQNIVSEDFAQDYLEILGDTDSFNSFQEALGLFGEDFEAQMSEIFDFDNLTEESFDNISNGFKNLFDDGVVKAKTFSKALVKAFTSPLGKLGLLVGAGVALYKTWEHFNLDSQEKRAQENLEEIKTAASIERSKLSQLSEEKTSYQTMKEEIDGLVEGSLEWKQAVSGLNEKTLDLKSRYSELEISKKDGIFSIDESSWDSIINKQQRAVDTLDNTKIVAQMQIDEIGFKRSLNKVVQSSNLSEGFSFASENIYSLLSADAMYNVLGQYGGGFKKADSSYWEALSQERALYDSIKESRRKEIVETSISKDISEANSELVSNLITKGGISWGKDGEYNKSVEDRVDSYIHSYDFWSEKALQKEYAKKIGGVYKGGKLYTDETYSEEIALDKSGLKQALAANATMDQISEYSEQLDQNLKTLNAQQKEQLKELFSTEGQDITTSTLREFYQDGQLNKQALEGFAKENGFDNAKDMVKKLGMSVDTFYDAIESNLNMAKSRVEKQRKNVVKKLSSYGNTITGQIIDDAAMLSMLEAKFGDYNILGAFESVISSLESTGDADLISAGLQGFQTATQFGTQAEVEELKSFISDTNWNSPIEAANALNEELKTGSELTKTYVQQLLNVESSYLGAGSQMRYFWETSQDSELGENLNEIIAASGELTATDILGLASEYKVLDQMLKNTGVTAEGVAKALEALSKGEINTSSLTDAVVASLKGLGGLESLVAKTIDNISKFDLGVDEGQVGEFNASNYGVIKEQLEKGAYGNSQIDRIFDFYFGNDWDQGATNEDELKKIIDARAEDLSKFENNMRPAWQEIADMKDQSVLGGMSVTSDGKEITLSGYEGLTTDEIVTRLQQATGKSREYAEMMLVDFKNYSLDLAKELQQNDLVAGVEESYKELGEFGKQKWIDQSEIDTIAKLFGVSPEEVLKQFQDQAATAGGNLQVTNFYDEKGNLKETQEILNEIGKQQQQINSNSEKTASLGNDWVDQLQNGMITVDQLKSNLAEVGVPKDKINQMTEDIISGIREANGEEVTVKAKMPDGSIQDITVKAGQSFEEAYNQAVKEFDAGTLADAIAAAFANFSVDPNTFAGLKTGIEAAVAAGQETDIVLSGEVNASTVSDAIITAINTASNTPVNLKVNPATVTVTGMASGTVKISAYKDGITNASVSHPALVGEEGPELIETASGAYLAGIGGPEVTNINKGDTVHTAQETKKILKGNRHKTMPRFKDGKSGSTAYGNAPGNNKGGNGSGDGKDDSWENGIDKLYNLIQEIGEEQRQRSRIERRYEKLLESINSSTSDLISLSWQELDQLYLEEKLQKDFIAGRLDQILDFQVKKENQKYKDYVWTEQKTQEDGTVDTILRIDWKKINGITNKEFGDGLNDFLSQLEDWVDSVNDASDAIFEIEDAVDEIKQRGKEEYESFEDQVKNAYIAAREAEIEKLSQINESIKDSNQDLIASIQQNINQLRQNRENKKTEQELIDDRQRLSYLQADTSGGNQLEILELQKEISEKEQNYMDSLIDQQISRLEEQNDKAAEAREKQIKIAETQLSHEIETGQIWEDIYTIMDAGMGPDGTLVKGSQLETLLQSEAGFKGLSVIGKMNWLADLEETMKAALTYLEIGRQLETVGLGNLGLKEGDEIEFTDAEGKVLKGEVQADGSVKVGDKTYTNVYQSYDGSFHAGVGTKEAEDEQKPSGNNNTGNGNGNDNGNGNGNGNGDDDGDYDDNNNGNKKWIIKTPSGVYITTFTGTEAQVKKQFPGYAIYGEDGKQIQTGASSYPETLQPKLTEAQKSAIADLEAAEKAAAKEEGKQDIHQKAAEKVAQQVAAEKAAEEANKKAAAEAEARKQAALKAEAEAEKNAKQAEANQKKTGGFFSKLFGKKYATGGLADFTGPAWLDGTKSRPEYVLNAQQTKSFFTLVDTLESLKHKTPNSQTENHGDTIYDIDINIETVKEEADVDMLVDKVQKSIVNASQYRNNNAIKRR